jgi:type IV secretory pathway TraG/TraD family ATPase VirD4
MRLFGRLRERRGGKAGEAPEGIQETGAAFFGGRYLPDEETTRHFLAVGTTGSGKTVVLRLLMQSVLPLIAEGSDTRAILNDAKQDLMPILGSILPSQRVRTSNPFDERGYSWCLWKDVQEPRVAVEIAFTLIPREHESQPFFADAARHLMYGVMISFMLSGREWMFADLVRTLRSQRILKQVLRKHPYTRDLIGLYFRDARLLSNIMSTIATRMMAFETIAAAWESAANSFSLEDWLTSEYALVLGNAHTSRAAIEAINRCVFKRACDLTLNLPDSFTRSNWFFLDEVSSAGKHESLVSLLKEGRSKGARAVLATQSLSGLRDPKMYGPHVTDEILGLIGNRFIGRIECPDTAEWLSRLFGDQEIVQISRGVTSSAGHGSSSNVSRSSGIRRAVLPSELMNLPGASSTRGIPGYYLLREYGCFDVTLPAPEVFEEWLEPLSTEIPHFVPRSVQSQFLRDWSPERAAEFGLELSTPQQKSEHRTVERVHRTEGERMEGALRTNNRETGIDPASLDDLFR